MTFEENAEAIKDVQPIPRPKSKWRREAMLFRAELHMAEWELQREKDKNEDLDFTNKCLIATVICLAIACCILGLL